MIAHFFCCRLRSRFNSLREEKSHFEVNFNNLIADQRDDTLSPLWFTRSASESRLSPCGCVDTAPTKGVSASRLPPAPSMFPS